VPRVTTAAFAMRDITFSFLIGEHDPHFVAARPFNAPAHRGSRRPSVDHPFRTGVWGRRSPTPESGQKKGPRGEGERRLGPASGIRSDRASDWRHPSGVPA
jgi:hypothetical protein